MSKFTKDKLVTGDLIKIFRSKDEDDEYTRVFLNTENGDIVSGDTWFPLKDYSDDTLFNWTKPNTFGSTFTEVWRPKSNIAFKSNKPSEQTHALVWQRVKTEEEINIELIESEIADLNAKLASLNLELSELKGA